MFDHNPFSGVIRTPHQLVVSLSWFPFGGFPLVVSLWRFPLNTKKEIFGRKNATELGIYIPEHGLDAFFVDPAL